MKYFHKPSIFTFCLVLIGAFSPSFAQTTSNNSMDFENWVERMRNQAFSKGISIDTLQNTFYQNNKIDLSRKTKTPTGENLQNRLALSEMLRRQYGDTLFEISHLFGVNADVLAAIASLENEANEKYPAIDIFINRSFLQPRDGKIQNELLQALKIVDEGQIEAEHLTSDINGKLGKVRFSPSIFRDYAVDFDGDGRYDVWQNYADIFASTANYLSNIGWKTGENWGIEVGLPEAFDMKLVNINQQKNLSSWQEFGVFQADGNELPDSSQLGSLIQMENNKFYIVLDNYFALLRWNRSKGYAHTIGLLIDSMKIKSP